MLRILGFAALWFAFGFVCNAAAQVDPALVQKLREGGYVLYMRHAATDFSQNDSRMTSYEDCANQRNLPTRAAPKRARSGCM
jgi:hypothetical protein